jgi:hypothetical protein
VVYVIVLVILFAVVVVITAPLRRGPAGANAEAELENPDVSSEVLELEAERDAKYREIRDAELDHQTAKLSDEDFQAVDSTLRAEAIDILRRLDQAKATEP